MVVEYDYEKSFAVRFVRLMFILGLPEAFLDRLLEGRPVVCEMQTKLDKQIFNIGHKSIHRIERLDMRICDRNVNSLPLL